MRNNHKYKKELRIKDVVNVFIWIILIIAPNFLNPLLKIKSIGIIPIYLWLTLILNFIVLFIYLRALRKRKVLHKFPSFVLLVLIMVSNYQISNIQAGNVIPYHKVFYACTFVFCIVEFFLFCKICILSQRETSSRSLMYLVFSILQIILLFGSIYSAMYYWNFSEGIEIFEKTVHTDEAILFLDFIYFSTITFTSVGYGDIIPVSNMAKIVVMLETIIYPIFIGVIVIKFKEILENEKYSSHNTKK